MKQPEPISAVARILCADDDDSVLSIVGETLRGDGFEVETAPDGKHALSKLAKDDRNFDLLITDGRMPQLDGWGLIEGARASGFRGKIIVFSASMSEAERERFEGLGVDAIVAKPGASELKRTVRRLAGQG